MSPVLRNILAVVAGVVVGSIVNMGIIMISGSIIPPPEGVDVTSADSLKESIHLFQPRHFIMPFLAHALGTLAGAFTAAYISRDQKLRFGLLIGVFFLIGGIMNARMIPAPTWFVALDLILAYLPMAWLAVQLEARLHSTE